MLEGTDLLHLAERRRAPEREADIYTTPGAEHLRHRLTRQLHQALPTDQDAVRPR